MPTPACWESRLWRWKRPILKRPPEGQKAFIEQTEVVPPEWAPWSLMGAGAVVVLYSFTIPKRVGG